MNLEHGEICAETNPLPQPTAEHPVFTRSAARALAHVGEPVSVAAAFFHLRNTQPANSALAPISNAICAPRGSVTNGSHVNNHNTTDHCNNNPTADTLPSPLQHTGSYRIDHANVIPHISRSNCILPMTHVTSNSESVHLTSASKNSHRLLSQLRQIEHSRPGKRVRNTHIATGLRSSINKTTRSNCMNGAGHWHQRDLLQHQLTPSANVAPHYPNRAAPTNSINTMQSSAAAAEAAGSLIPQVLDAPHGKRPPTFTAPVDLNSPASGAGVVVDAASSASFWINQRPPQSRGQIQPTQSQLAQQNQLLELLHHQQQLSQRIPLQNAHQQQPQQLHPQQPQQQQQQQQQQHQQHQHYSQLHHHRQTPLQQQQSQSTLQPQQQQQQQQPSRHPQQQQQQQKSQITHHHQLQSLQRLQQEQQFHQQIQNFRQQQQQQQQFQLRQQQLQHQQQLHHQQQQQQQQQQQHQSQNQMQAQNSILIQKQNFQVSNQIPTAFNVRQQCRPPIIPQSGISAPSKSILTSTNTATGAAAPPAKAHVSNDQEGHFVVMLGSYINKKYLIQKQLGQGTFGRVVECDDLEAGGRVAVKVVRSTPKYFEAAQTEIRLLQTIQKSNRPGSNLCIQLLTHFIHSGHVCMVFPLLGCSLYDFMRGNKFLPFSVPEVAIIGAQLVEAVGFLHGISIIHTDLKPENILLTDVHAAHCVPAYTKHISVSNKTPSRKVALAPPASQLRLWNLGIKVIDFGSAIFSKEYHSSVVSTRHYRSPEITLELGWSFPIDMWSIGCILVELAIGEALFQTHENVQHIAMMEVILGRFPQFLGKDSFPPPRLQETRAKSKDLTSISPSMPDSAQSKNVVAVNSQVAVCNTNNCHFQKPLLNIQGAHQAPVAAEKVIVPPAANSQRELPKFTKGGRLIYPLPSTKPEATSFVYSLKSFEKIFMEIEIAEASNNLDFSRFFLGVIRMSAPGAGRYCDLSVQVDCNLTRLFRDLVARLLIYDPTQRLTAEQALLHPFLSMFRNVLNVPIVRSNISKQPSPAISAPTSPNCFISSNCQSYQTVIPVAGGQTIYPTILSAGFSQKDFPSSTLNPSTLKFWDNMRLTLFTGSGSRLRSSDSGHSGPLEMSLSSSTASSSPGVNCVTKAMEVSSMMVTPPRTMRTHGSPQHNLHRPQQYAPQDPSMASSEAYNPTFRHFHAFDQGNVAGHDINGHESASMALLRQQKSTFVSQQQVVASRPQNAGTLSNINIKNQVQNQEYPSLFLRPPSPLNVPQPLAVKRSNNCLFTMAAPVNRIRINASNSTQNYSAPNISQLKQLSTYSSLESGSQTVINPPTALPVRQHYPNTSHNVPQSSSDDTRLAACGESCFQVQQGRCDQLFSTTNPNPAGWDFAGTTQLIDQQQYLNRVNQKQYRNQTSLQDSVRAKLNEGQSSKSPHSSTETNNTSQHYDCSSVPSQYPFQVFPLLDSSHDDSNGSDYTLQNWRPQNEENRHQLVGSSVSQRDALRAGAAAQSLVQETSQTHIQRFSCQQEQNRLLIPNSASVSYKTQSDGLGSSSQANFGIIPRHSYKNSQSLKVQDGEFSSPKGSSNQKESFYFNKPGTGNMASQNGQSSQLKQVFATGSTPLLLTHRPKLFHEGVIGGNIFSGGPLPESGEQQH